MCIYVIAEHLRNFECNHTYFTLVFWKLGHQVLIAVDFDNEFENLD